MERYCSTGAQSMTVLLLQQSRSREVNYKIPDIWCRLMVGAISKDRTGTTLSHQPFEPNLESAGKAVSGRVTYQ
jgi:hypothetical protein